MKKYLFSLLCALLVFVCACKVQEDIYFSKDMSGKMSYKIDMSAMRAFSAQMQDSMKDIDSNAIMPPQNPFAALDTLNIEQATSQFSNLKGISNVKAKRSKEGSFEISFDFET